MKKFAFTLSEILITLTIVGVVAVLTVPNVAKNIYTKADIANLQSTLKNINDSVKTMMVNEHVTHIVDSSLSNSEMNGFYNKYLKTNKLCDNTEDCFATKYASFNGDVYSFVQNVDSNVTVYDITPIATLPSGVALLYVNKDEDFVTNVDEFKDSHGNFLNVFVVDVNGVKPPNIIGVDLFSFGMDDRGNIGYFGAIPEDEDAMSDLRDTCRSGDDYGMSCAYLLQEGSWDAKIISQQYPD